MKEGQFAQTLTRSGLSTTDVSGYCVLKRSTTGNEDFKFAVAGAADGLSACGIAIGDADTDKDEAVGCAYVGPGMGNVNGGTVNIAAGDFLKPAASGVLVKAYPGEPYIAIAEEPATADDLDIRIYIHKGIAASSGAYTSVTGASGSVTAAAGFGTGAGVVVCSNNGTCALTIPDAALLMPGTTLLVKKTGTAGAVTITPAAGTINGAANHAAIDAQGDTAIFFTDGTNWLLGPSTIA